MNAINIKTENRLIIGFGLNLLLIAGMVILSSIKLFDAGNGDLSVVLGCGIIAIFTSAMISWWAYKSIRRPLRDTLFVARKMAEGDISELFEANDDGDIGEIQQALQKISQRMFEIVGKVRAGMGAIATTSGFITTDNTALSSRTESQASSLEQTAASMEQLTSTVKQNAANAQHANKLVSTATTSAEKGGEIMTQVIQTMGSINDSSKKIVDIISVIDGIAFQTNILALNAAVEAARAGEQGRGFAVVASEVRSLAQRSASAAKEIKELIGNSVEKVTAGSNLVDGAGSAMTDIVTNVKSVAAIMAAIAEASMEQSAGLDEVNRAVIQIDGMTQQNAALVEEGARTAANLRHQAESLTKMVSVFDLGVREFGNADEAVAMVKRGVEFVQAHGVTAFVEDVRKLNESQFIDRDLYFSVYDMDVKCLANGANPRYVGIDGRIFKDADGKLFVLEIVNVAKQRGSGWVDYKHPHPLTKVILQKTTYFERVDGIVITCGFYKR
jgi:methyl-accepting chemotaxis protein